MSSANILTAFNDHFVEFVTDVHSAFPEEKDILVAKNALLMIRKANTKMIINLWNECVVGRYKGEIERGDISFFVDKDYSHDLEGSQNSDKIRNAIDRLRVPIKQMIPEEQAKAMKYIQNLTKLADIYHISSKTN
jgi:hypothetical protein